MALPNARVSPEEVFESFAEDTVAEVIALADEDDTPGTTAVESDEFEGFLADEQRDEPVAVAGPEADPAEELDLDELFS
ncbi:hypothetical protein [Haloarchaeobius amylolyticus]|uniref:hypothetical protein n=1 Tax=Haloarchaeobius amylolyticus TaxID=1198296 RepID=UPI00226E1612|nr:hypothetical protein [Haloarchaeobius amylolyticus]